MKKVLLASAALVVLASPAFAGDLTAPPAYSSGYIAPSAPAPAPAIVSPAPIRAPVIDWSGAYFGAILGYSFGSVSGDASQFTVLNQPLNPNVNGFSGGLSTGYNYQYTQWVFGFVADVVGSNITGSKSDATTLSATNANLFYGLNPGSGPAFTKQTNVNASVDTTTQYLGTVRGRLGYSWYDSPFMLYGTGGFAFANMKMSLSTTGSDGNLFQSTAVSQNTTLYGYAVGAGIEVMLDRNFSAGLEYLYVGLAKQTYFAGTLGNGINAGEGINNFRADLKYHF